jgi:N-ethylmaleimide reductase
MYSAEQTAGWKLVTSAIHAKGAKIFVQLMHCGRIAHPLNMPQGARILAPSALAAAGQMWTDAQGMQPQPVPEAMTEADLKQAIEEYVLSAKNAMAAGFDGIELHAANGYLLEQFIRPNTNLRTDRYGGTIEGRSRLVLEIADALIATVGKDKVGIRISPFGIYNDMPLYPQMEADYTYLARQLNERGLLYIHLVDHSSMGGPAIPESIPTMLRSMSNCALILSGGYNYERAEAALAAGRCDLVAAGRPVLANPDLIARWNSGAAENAPDFSTFYTPGPKGYTDYPTLG